MTSFLQFVLNDMAQKQPSKLTLEDLNNDMDQYSDEQQLDLGNYEQPTDLPPEELDADLDTDLEDDANYIDLDGLSPEELAKEIEDLKADLEEATARGEDPEIVAQIIDNLKCIKSCIEQKLESEGQPDENELGVDALSDDTTDDLDLGINFDNLDPRFDDAEIGRDEDDFNDLNQDSSEFDFDEDEDDFSDFEDFEKSPVREAKAVDVDKAKNHRERVDGILRTKGAATHKSPKDYDRAKDKKDVKDTVKQIDEDAIDAFIKALNEGK